MKEIKIILPLIVFLLFSCEQKEVAVTELQSSNLKSECSDLTDPQCTLNNTSDSQAHCSQILGASWIESTLQCKKPQSKLDCVKSGSDIVWNGNICEPSKAPKNFYRHCTAPTVTEEMAKSLEVIRKNYNDSSCQVVFSVLYNKKKIDLSSENLSDISILFGLDKLEELILFRNEISDISTLSYLKNLKFLDLGNNNITDVSSLKSLKNLEQLYLQENSIIDPSPLSSMTSLQILNLEKNQITNFSSLEVLNLGNKLYTSGNNIISQEEIDNLQKQDPNTK